MSDHLTARPPVGTKVVFSYGLHIQGATIVPTGKDIPTDEVNVMLDDTGRVMTVQLLRLTVTSEIYGTERNAGD